MYFKPKPLFVANLIKRYSIGDRTPGLKYNEDGSLEIYLHKDSPDPYKESNWLPAPEGGFHVTLRIYQPGEEVLDGSYTLPPIRRVR